MVTCHGGSLQKMFFLWICQLLSGELDLIVTAAPATLLHAAIERKTQKRQEVPMLRVQSQLRLKKSVEYK